MLSPPPFPREVNVSSRRTYASGSPWEPIAGYSRSIRVGRSIHVSGTTALDEQGRLVGAGDPRAQTLQCLRNVERALAALGGSLRDVVRTRMYVTDISRWEAIARVHGEVFGDVRPATSMVEVSALIEPDMLIEIEAEAIVEEENNHD
jgi:enamine deaminase RidA (YjgF/YER057c/UK114 family)